MCDFGGPLYTGHVILRMRSITWPVYRGVLRNG